MNCPSCAHENQEAAKFCSECAGPLTQDVACPACGSANVRGSRFCNECAQPLAGRSASVPGVAPAPLPPLPHSFVGGRYLVKSFLGEGGRKRVYLAHDTRLDRDVAFAAIKTEGLDSDGVERVRREAQAMGRLGDHPHIVTIHDVGEDDGSQYIVSQYMAGGAVEDLVAKAEDHRLATSDALRIAGEVCEALEHAHSRGIVHRDLKPGNVWLAGDGTAQLGDFGLAVSLDRSRMTMQGMMVGTVAYMSPEQALGRTPDARSDLYSLGAMLYEMVTGRPPFVGDDAIGIISQHINTAPVAPSWHNSELPRALETVILHLLAKPPDDRPASAEEVRAALSQINQASSQESIVQPVSEVMGGELGALEWGRFVGRQEEMDQLKESLEKALSGRGALALIAGEPGVGKTRLVDEFTVYARMRGAQVLTGRCYEGDSSAPYRPFVEALRRYVRAQPDPAVREQLGAGAPEVATLVSEIRERFPDLPQPMNVEGEAQRMRLFDAITSFLRSASRSQPIILFLDDLQWADRPSLALLKYLARESGEDRLLVVSTYRDVEVDDKHPLSEALPELRRTLNYRRIGLQGLSREEVRDMMEALEPSSEARQQAHLLAAILYRETEGNPLFIREVVNNLIEEGKLFREGGHWTSRATTISELGIPDSVRDVVQRRITRLSEPCRRVLTRASAMTHGFTWEALKAISGEEESALLDLLDEALAAQIIAERGDQAQLTYDFTQTLIRQSLREELSRPRWIILHREIGEVLEKLYADNIDAHLAELAHHFYRAAPGGDVGKAIDYAIRAGQRAMQLNGWEEAIDNYNRAIELMPEREYDDQKCRVLLALGEALEHSGRPAEAVDAYRRAAVAARTLGSADLLGEAACGFEGAGYFITGDGLLWSERLELIDEALAELESGDSALRARLLAHRARPAHAVAAGDDAVRSGGVGSLFGHRDPEIMRGAREAVAIARRVGDPAVIALVCDRLLEWLSGPGDAAEAGELSKMCVQFAREAGDKRTESQGEVWGFTSSLVMGEIAAARDALQRHAQLAEQIKIGWALWQTLAGRVSLGLMEGRLGEAESAVFEALSFGQSINHPTALTTFGAQLFGLRWYQGRLAEVETMFRGLHEQSPGTEAYAAGLALMFVETGRAAETTDILGRLASRGFGSIPEDGIWAINIVVLSEAIARLGATAKEHATALYDVALRHPEGNASSGIVISLGAMARSLGQLATLLERWDDAERHSQDALDLNEKMEHRPALAQTRRDYATMLIRRDGPGDRAKALPLLQQAIDAAQEMGMKNLVEDCLALKLQAQGIDRAQLSASAALNTSIDRVLTTVNSDHPNLRPQAAPDGTVTIMFSDIEGSTEKTEQLGDTRWMEVLRGHNAIIREQLKSHDGFEVKSEGDGFMLAFQSARKAIQCAIAIQKAMAATLGAPIASSAHPEAHEKPLSAHPEAHEGRAAPQTPQIKVRMGLHTGEVIKEGDDFFGKHVNLAARVAGKASGGEILASSLLRELTASGGDIAFGDPRTVEFKGLTGEHQVWPVEWS